VNSVVRPTEQLHANLRTLEQLGTVEFWSQDGAVTAVVMRQETICPMCRQKHFVFLNRDGRTRCVFCDDEYVLGGAGRSQEVSA
jgi:hypothetical protein